jgi:hypothetical protein
MWFIVAALNRGCISAESEQPHNIATKNRTCTDPARMHVALESHAEWESLTQSCPTFQVWTYSGGHRNSQCVSTLRVFTMWTMENLVFSFDILPPIIFKRHSKSVGVFLIKFLNPDSSCNFRVSKCQVNVWVLPRITDAYTNVWADGAIERTRTLRQQLTPVTWRREMTPNRPARCGHDPLYRGSVRAAQQHWIGEAEIQPCKNELQHWMQVCTRHYSVSQMCSLPCYVQMFCGAFWRGSWPIASINLHILERCHWRVLGLILSSLILQTRRF